MVFEYARRWIENFLGSGAEEDSPAPAGELPILYVDLLLQRMVEEEFFSLSVRRSEKLPVVGILEEDQSGLTYEKVANRLKVLSGLNPLLYKTKVEGSFSRELRPAKGDPFRIGAKTQFFDHETNPRFRIIIDRSGLPAK